MKLLSILRDREQQKAMEASLLDEELASKALYKRNSSAILSVGPIDKDSQTKQRNRTHTQNKGATK